MVTVQNYRRPSNGLAIAALVCGFVGLPFFPVALVALVLAIVALAKGQSRGMAITAIVCAVLGIVVVPFLIVKLVFSFAADAVAHRSLVQMYDAERRAVAEVRADHNGDGIGEFIDLDKLRATDPSTAKNIGVAKRLGIDLAILLPDTTIGRQRHMLIVAWPAAGSSMRHAFCIGADGVVRRRPAPAAPGVAPELSDPLPGGWDGPSTWPIDSKPTF